MNPLALARIIAMLFLLITPARSFEQILWNTQYEGESLNPETIQTVVDIRIKKNSITSYLKGDAIISFATQEIFFKSNEKLYRLEKNDIDGLNTPYGDYLPNEIFKESTIENIKMAYRKNLYASLALNKVKFSLAKKTTYEINDNGLTIKNEKILDGKICSIGPDRIDILESGGEILVIRDRDFNYLEFGGGRFLYCKSLYEKFFQSYPEQLETVISNWKRQFLDKTVESVMESIGPFNTAINLDDKKLFIWEKHNRVLSLDVRNVNSKIQTSFGYARADSYQSFSGSKFGSTVLSIPSLYSYQQSYGSLSSTLNLFGITSTASTTASAYNGQIQDMDVPVKVTLAFLAGKCVEVYHENIFSYPAYGMRFYFISF